MTADVKHVEKATVNKIPFRTEASQEGLKSDDTCVKSWYYESEADQSTTPMYGRIKSMFTHEMFPGNVMTVVWQLFIILSHPILLFCSEFVADSSCATYRWTQACGDSGRVDGAAPRQVHHRVGAGAGSPEPRLQHCFQVLLPEGVRALQRGFPSSVSE
jgi:hypothetical protein